MLHEGGVALEVDVFGRLYWDSGSFKSGCRVGCEPSIDVILQAAPAVIVWDSLAIIIRDVNAAIFDYGLSLGRGRGRGREA